MHNQNKQESWEIEFAMNFGMCSAGCDCGHCEIRRKTVNHLLHQEREKAVGETTDKIKNHKFNFFKADTALFDGNVKLSTVNQKNVIECEELITFLDSLHPTNKTKE